MIECTKEQVLSCCQCDSFASQVAANGPFRTFDDLLETSRHVWWHQVGGIQAFVQNILMKLESPPPVQTPLAGWLQALAAHPRLGDTKSLKAKFDPFTKMSLNEQSTAASSATEQELVELSDWNQRYEERFGHTFILCAAGKTSSEFLEAIKSRYNNDPANEIAIAATEQMKITELRMADAFTQGKDAERRATSILQHLTAKGSNTLHSKSPVTTHVLDTSLGKPAAGVRVELSVQSEGAVLRNLSTLAWTPVAQGQTNNDGRIFDLLPANSPLKPGVYRMTFFMQEYMGRCRLAHPSFYAAKPFFPLASVYFEISVQQVHDHFHIPLTWSPYGYSTYRGS